MEKFHVWIELGNGKGTKKIIETTTEASARSLAKTISSIEVGIPEEKIKIVSVIRRK